MTQDTLRRVLARAKVPIGEDVADAYEAVIDNAMLVSDELAEAFPSWPTFFGQILQLRRGNQVVPEAAVSAPTPGPAPEGASTAAPATTAATATIEISAGAARVERASNPEVESPRAASAPFVATGLLEAEAPTTTMTMEVGDEGVEGGEPISREGSGPTFLRCLVLSNGS